VVVTDETIRKIPEYLTSDSCCPRFIFVFAFTEALLLLEVFEAEDHGAHGNTGHTRATLDGTEGLIR